MKHGLFVSNIGEHADPRLLAELAREAETTGWDGFFLWDVLIFNAGPEDSVVDPWVALSAMATVTERIRLGTLVTPVARRRPWKLARETTSLDRLSNGRLILGVGLGDTPDIEFGRYGEETDNRVRAQKLDEGLEILDGLWSGQPFSFEGRHYQLEETRYRPTPVQTPRVPVWVVGSWPNQGPFRRAARWDGVFPAGANGRLTLGDLQEIQAYVRSQRTSAEPFDIVLCPSYLQEGVPLDTWREAGGTWWLESFSERQDSVRKLRELIRQGPPNAA